MERQSGYNERNLPPLQFSTDGNGLPLVPGDDTAHHYAMENGSVFMTKTPVENIIQSLPADNSALPVHGAFPIHGEISFSADSCDEARKSCSSWMQGDLNGDNYNASSAPGPAWPKRRTSLTDRHRRLRIAERVTALQELLPQSATGSQGSALDDVIDHIKYLQLQIKDLSQIKLRGESTSEPFIFLEGYGHYISSNQEMLNEPLEEMLGKLLEVNPEAAAQLLNSKGLYLMPLDLAQGLC